jgi:hypothetical protein
MSKSDHASTERVDRPNRAIVFDPRYYQATTCPKECTPLVLCKHPIHGGFRLNRLMHTVPEPDWTDAMRTAKCFVCHCQGGKEACTVACECHAPASVVQEP